MFKYLKKEFNENFRHTHYAEAIIKYKNSEALDLLNQIVSKSRKDLSSRGWSYLRKDMIRQISYNFIGIYAALLFDLLEEEPHPFDVSFAEPLWRTDKERTYQFLLNILGYKTSCGDTFKSDVLTGKIRDSIAKNAPEFIKRFNTDLKSR